MSRAFAILLGYAWSSRLSGAAIVAATSAALAAFGCGAAFGASARGSYDASTPPPAGLGVAIFLAATLSTPLFVFAARVLLRARRAPAGMRRCAVVAARSVAPASVYAGLVAAVFPPDRPPSIAFPIFLAVAGANVLFGVAEGAKAPSEPSRTRTS